MTADQTVTFFRRALRIARTEIAAVSALFIIALGVMTFVELAEDQQLAVIDRTFQERIGS
mgnify:CR=1 FL=1